MSDFSCKRCQKTDHQMSDSPVPGKLGKILQANTCSDCWQEWDEAQVMLINEHRLNLAVAQHYEMLINEMKTFLKLEEV